MSVKSFVISLLLACVAGLVGFQFGEKIRVVEVPLPAACKPSCQVTGPNGLYLDLMAKSLTGYLHEKDPKIRVLRVDGKDWPDGSKEHSGYTMVGLKRLKNIETLFDQVLRDKVPGDLLEAGAWRGGATIFMRALLEARGVVDRRVWVADSFEGLPPPNPEFYPADKGLNLHLVKGFIAPVESVRATFERYGLLDDQVRFLVGWFKDTLPEAPIEKLSILRVDADLYESTIDALNMLYDKVSPGGFIIIDDYGALGACRKAVEDFRSKRGITSRIEKIDWTGVYWRKPLS